VFIYLLSQIKIHKIDSNDNNCDIVLNGHKGSMSTYRCPQWSRVGQKKWYLSYNV